MLPQATASHVVIMHIGEYVHTNCLCVFPLSIHNAVISVFQRKDLGENELYTLNEGVRLALCVFVSVFLTLFQTFHTSTLNIALVCILGRDLTKL